MPTLKTRFALIRPKVRGNWNTLGIVKAKKIKQAIAQEEFLP
jgi:hypothetical protein